MKIVHLSTYDSGGAATAALRLHVGLLQLRVDSSFLSLRVTDPYRYPSKHTFRQRSPSLPARILGKIGLSITQNDRNQRLTGRLPGTYEIFSFPLTDNRVETHPLVQDADIINLHWVADFINYPTFFRSIAKPMVWTLHDMNPLMGGFHYTGDKERNTSCHLLEEKQRRIKEEALNNVQKLHVVTPSEWLRRQVAKYPPLARFDNSCIPYGLDLNVFKPYNKAFARDVCGIPASKKVLLFASEWLSNYRKGFDILEAALNQLNLPDSVQLVTVGTASKDLQPNPTLIAMGAIKDERIMALLFSAADLFILPSREDNLPNVMLESLACGTPVLAFMNGGMPEVIQHGVTGILAEGITPESLSNGIQQFLNGKFSFDPFQIREYVVENFDLKIQASRYRELYRQILQA